jgi:hypothetical protein
MLMGKFNPLINIKIGITTNTKTNIHIRQFTNLLATSPFNNGIKPFDRTFFSSPLKVEALLINPKGFHVY